MIFGTIDDKGVMIKNLELDLDTLPSEDPIAFGYGIYRGQLFQKELHPDFNHIHGEKFSELAQEYLRGFLLGYRGILVPEGTKIRKGQESSYFLGYLNLLKT